MNVRMLLPALAILASCKTKEDAGAADATPDEVRTPVTVTSIAVTPLQTFAELNATSAFLQSNFIKATANGYIKQVNVQLGQRVTPGQTAFVLRTKEAEALGNTINKLDPSFHFTGIIPIRVTANGFIQELNHQPGDYVQDGEQLAVIADTKSFGFVLNVPYELRPFVNVGNVLEVSLPDGKKLPGRVSRILPAVDSLAQTQQVLLQVSSGTVLPQNLVAHVRIVKAQRQGAPSLPKAAVLADEAQEHFWVMKLLDSATAVRVDVIKGLETGDRVEILSPHFSAADRFVLTGNYGLPDTAKVIIQKNGQ